MGIGRNGFDFPFLGSLYDSQWAGREYGQPPIISFDFSCVGYFVDAPVSNLKLFLHFRSLIMRAVNELEKNLMQKKGTLCQSESNMGRHGTIWV